MVQFHIKPDSDIPASSQLFNQIRLAIASGQFSPGQRLPSTRALAMQTGLHRNTISKVYRQLEDLGLVDSQAGSGIYVRSQGNDGTSKRASPMFDRYPEAYPIVQQGLDELLTLGCSLHEARELFLGEIDWRLRCSARVLVTAPTEDIGVGKLMVQELEEALGMFVQLVPLEELDAVLDKAASGTVVTSRYFIGQAEAIAAPRSVRVLPVDIYDYAEEIELVKSLPTGTCLGLVSLSSGILRAAEVIVYSLRGEDILTVTAPKDDSYKIGALVRRARTIICDPGSFDAVKEAIENARDDLIRAPQVFCLENYIRSESIGLLKRELGLA